MRRLVRLLSILILGCLAANAQDNVYFGNLHSHTSYSDGSGTPRQAYRHARNVARVDFLAITEHNHSKAEQGASADRQDGILIAKNHNLYSGSGPNSLISAANAANVDGTFVALYGQEFSSISSGNHVNIFDVPEVITVPNGAYDQLVAFLGSIRDSRNKQPILQMNHPGLNGNNPAKDYGQDDFSTKAEWIEQVDRFARTIAILNGPHSVKTADNRPPPSLESQYLRYLSLGFHVAPIADQDNHYRTWGDATTARSAVIAPALTKQNILDGIDKRHVYATEDKNLRVVVRVNGSLIGERVQAPQVDSALDIQFSLRDDDEPSAGYAVEVFSGVIGSGNAVVVEKLEIEGDTTDGGIDSVKYEGGQQYVFFKITQLNEDGDRDRAWTAPVWFETTASSGIPLAPTEGEFVASKKRSIYHFASCRDARNISPANKVTGSEATRGRTLHEGCPRQ